MAHCSVEDCQHPEAEMSCPIKVLLFPPLLQEVLMEEGGYGGRISHKAIFECQLVSSLGITAVFRKVRIHLSSNPTSPQPLRPGLVGFVCCFCCYSHLPVGSFQIPIS